jgi:hypothetical protein
LRLPSAGVAQQHHPELPDRSGARIHVPTNESARARVATVMVIRECSFSLGWAVCSGWADGVEAELSGVGAERACVPLPGLRGALSSGGGFGPAVDDRDQRPIVKDACVRERFDLLCELVAVAASAGGEPLDALDDLKCLGRTWIHSVPDSGAGVLADRRCRVVAAVGLLA